MARRKHSQSPHFGVTRGYWRKGLRIRTSDGTVVRDCESVSRAKRFMRTGSEKRQ